MESAIRCRVEMQGAIKALSDFGQLNKFGIGPWRKLIAKCTARLDPTFTCCYPEFAESADAAKAAKAPSAEGFRDGIRSESFENMKTYVLRLFEQFRNWTKSMSRILIIHGFRSVSRLANLKINKSL